MADCITYDSIPYYSQLIRDYLSEKEHLKPFYHQFPRLENFKSQLEEKAAQFPIAHRRVLQDVLGHQYRDVEISKPTAANIQALADPNTFTIVTGHQLNLYSGPLYFLYKIISVIKLTKQLKMAYPAYNFVPVYWMASEDHDFEEINYFNHRQKQIWWDSDQKGPVGRFSTTGLKDVLSAFTAELSQADNAKQLTDWFEQAYCKHDNLAAATRYLANELFNDQGLVIVDGDDRDLKRLFVPYVKDELLHETAHKNVMASAEKLNQLGYKTQVNPREINLFYIKDGLRERILKDGDQYSVNDTAITFSEDEILAELDKYPERFSPNAIMRPLFQEVILPNLSYVGGSGELAYWLELKAYFNAVDVVFPSLLLRNSAVLITEKQDKKRQQLNLSYEDLFCKQNDLITAQTKRISAIPIDFTPQREHLHQQFAELYTLAEKTDSSFYGAVAAQEKKQIKGLEHLEKRLLKAQKRRLKDELKRTTKLQDELFPSGNLQERVTNFSVFYEPYGARLLNKLYKELEPLDLEFNIITL